MSYNKNTDSLKNNLKMLNRLKNLPNTPFRDFFREEAILRNTTKQRGIGIANKDDE